LLLANAAYKDKEGVALIECWHFAAMPAVTLDARD
jgi:hypothetical protein